MAGAKTALLTAVTWLGFFWLTLVCSKKGIMGYNEWNRIGDELKADKYFCDTTCSAANAARNLGQRNVECHKACTHGHRSAFVEAVYHALSNTYLCGDNKCSDVVADMLSSWRKAFAIVIVLLLLPTMGSLAVNALLGAASLRAITGAHNKRCAVEAPSCTVLELDHQKAD